MFISKIHVKLTTRWDLKDDNYLLETVKEGHTCREKSNIQKAISIYELAKPE